MQGLLAFIQSAICFRSVSSNLFARFRTHFALFKTNDKPAVNHRKACCGRKWVKTSPCHPCQSSRETFSKRWFRVFFYLARNNFFTVAHIWDQERAQALLLQWPAVISYYCTHTYQVVLLTPLKHLNGCASVLFGRTGMACIHSLWVSVVFGQGKRSQSVRVSVQD